MTEFKSWTSDDWRRFFELCSETLAPEAKGQSRTLVDEVHEVLNTVVGSSSTFFLQNWGYRPPAQRFSLPQPPRRFRQPAPPSPPPKLSHLCIEILPKNGLFDDGKLIAALSQTRINGSQLYGEWGSICTIYGEPDSWHILFKGHPIEALLPPSLRVYMVAATELRFIIWRMKPPIASDWAILRREVSEKSIIGDLVVRTCLSFVEWKKTWKALHTGFTLLNAAYYTPSTGRQFDFQGNPRPTVGRVSVAVSAARVDSVNQALLQQLLEQLSGKDINERSGDLEKYKGLVVKEGATSWSLAVYSTSWIDQSPSKNSHLLMIEYVIQKDDLKDNSPMFMETQQLSLNKVFKRSLKRSEIRNYRRACVDAVARGASSLGKRST